MLTGPSHSELYTPARSIQNTEKTLQMQYMNSMTMFSLDKEFGRSVNRAGSFLGVGAVGGKGGGRTGGALTKQGV